MNIGPLSEWVTAIAETIAVCVALFLPMITQSRERHRREIKFKRMITKLTNETLAGDDEARQELASFLRISLYIVQSSKEDDIMDIGSRINDILSKPNLEPTDKKHIQELLTQLS
ncbi:hypothetical protein [Pediococcus claussenii]|uniref:Uncharacterized protein n=1 Tax=Pediococcus claussenii (strain ATCC BAA-344 / DSM 14800 / JCM 18046 / KCTC 3811 / LMG 21948 / P06) TaxID=701521 RepID=G8PAF8_PEDCP|nr:hypothetical protein [Pediococcus claussenii]AEV95747.1 hypothetical protein PECL_1527 [Pediococcus claussenii ATCC BAA-344]ANZ69256.1 hypothetical protein AYR57_02590 [Pediococcus claussenii]ANZ71075.1 hypothetical protein AYR58_02605 [Pediococcus claussenii]KRN20357.1 hypothetical protein IV79_GL000410 [Pediococcus claussenii]